MNYLEYVFQWILVSSARASLLTLVIICMQVTLRQYLTIRWRYALWIPFILVLVLPYLPSSKWGIENHYVSSIMETVIPVTAKMQTSPMKPELLGQPTILDTRNIAPLLPIFWALGFVCSMTFGLLSYMKTMERIHQRSIPQSKDVTDKVNRTARELGLSYTPQIIQSNAVESPAVAGFFRSMVLLPVDFPDGLTRSEARLVLFHELLHLKRRDIVLNWLLFILVAAHWFNPLIWLAANRIREDREKDCDAQVLGLQVGDSRSDYGNALLKLESGSFNPRFCLGFVGIFSNSCLRSRIFEITQFRHGRPNWSILGIISIVLLTLAGATHADDSNKSTKKMIKVGFVLVTSFEKQFETTEDTLTTFKTRDGETFVSILTSNSEASALFKKAEASGGHVLKKQEWLMEDGDARTLKMNVETLNQKLSGNNKPSPWTFIFNGTFLPRSSRDEVDLNLNLSLSTEIGSHVSGSEGEKVGKTTVATGDYTAHLALSQTCVFIDIGSDGQSKMAFITATH